MKILLEIKRIHTDWKQVQAIENEKGYILFPKAAFNNITEIGKCLSAKSSNMFT